jgi:hypothetical protein
MYSINVETDHFRRLVESNRLFYSFFVWCARRALTAVGFPMRAFTLFQLLSLGSSVGTLGLAGFWIARRKGGVLATAVVALAGTTSVWWRFSVEPHSHMPSLLPALGALLVWDGWLRDGRPRRLLLAGALWAAATVLHQAHVLLAFVFLASAWRRRPAWIFVGAVGAVLLGLYGLGATVARAWSSPGFVAFCLGKGGQASLWSPSPWVFLKTGWGALFGGSWAAWALLAAAVAASIGRGPIEKDAGTRRWIIAWAGVYGAFFLVFDPGNVFFWVFLLWPFLLLLAEGAGRPKVVGALLLLAAALHFPAGRAERGRAADPEACPSVARALEWSRQSGPADLFLVTETPDARFPFQLTVFGGRTAVAVDRATGGRGAASVARIAALADSVDGMGGRVFLAEDAGAAVQGDARPAWEAFLASRDWSPAPWRGVLTGRRR